MGFLSDTWDDVTDAASSAWDTMKDGGIIPHEKKEAEKKAKASSSSEASDKMGQLYRDEFDNWMQQYFPLDQKLMSLASGREDNEQALQFAKDSTTNSFAQSRKADQLHRQGLGTALSDDERKYIEGRSQRSEKAALAESMNSARLHADDRDRRIALGGMSSSLSSASQQ